MKKKLYLVDCSSLFFRAFFAIRSLTAPNGMPTNAIYGFLSQILKLLKTEKPEFVVFCLDRGEESFRKEIYQDYKANRSETPEDLSPQLPYIRKIADLLGIPAVDMKGFEADDVIGTLARLGEEQGMQVYIVSGDKDFAQLVGDDIFMLDTMKEVVIDAKGVKEKWGVKPEQFRDYLAMVGDSSDNIPGIKGVGPKGAQTLIEEFGSLKAVYENLEKIKSESLKKKLVESKDNAFLSLKLVEIECGMPLDRDFSKYHLKPVDLEALRAFLLELNFRTIEKSLSDYKFLTANNGSIGFADAGASASPDSTATAAVKYGEAPAAVAMPAMDLSFEEIEVTELQKMIRPNASIWGLQNDQGVYLVDGNKVLALRGNPEAAGPIFDRLQVRWSGFELKSFWRRLHIQKPILEWDSQLAAYFVKAGESMTFDNIYTRYTGQVQKELASPMEFAQMHLQLRQAIESKVISARELLVNLDFTLSPILYSMEQRGVLVDTDMLREQSKTLGLEIQNLEKEIHSLAGETFNVASPKQLAQILFVKMKLPVGKKTKTGFSTDTDVLEKLRPHHPIADLLIKFRELTKLKSTYLDTLPQQLHADGRIHTTFNQALAATGRLSSIDPNLQNIPIRTENGARIRKAFVAKPGQLLMSADYSQIELRILAHYSKDANLTKAFIDDLDIHTATAAEIFSTPLDQVTTEQRRTAKAVNFGIAYGQGAFGLAEALGIPRGDAQEIIRKYFERFSGVKTYIEQTTLRAQEQGFVETLYGRRRYIDELRSQNGAIRKFGERAAINAPIQGTAADIVKMAMVELAKSVPVPMILQIHDELVFEGEESLLKKHELEIVRIMENVAKLSVPLKVNFGIGPNWDEAH